ncbi:conserved hypothetical protein [uncultured Desulfatiglans sp.]|nr:conserved hypothetical protein [uncultured Desulfatiglans sp.]
MFGERSSTDLTSDGLFRTFCDTLSARYNRTQATDFSRYRDDPVGFAQEVLGETLTYDIECLMLSVKDNPVTVARSANATGKTFAAARIAVWFYRVFEASQIYTGAAPPESNLKKLLWGEIGSIIDKHPALFEGDSVKNLHVARNAQSFLTGVTIPMAGSEAQREAKFSGKHAPYLLFIIDEGDAVPDEVYRGIESCMSGGHARLLVMFNPRHESGPVYRMEREGRANVVELSAFSHPNVTTGEDQIPGAVTREVTVRRISEWCRPLVPGEAATDSFRLPDFLAGATAVSQSGLVYPPLAPGQYKVLEPAFDYMVLGRYPAQASTQLISREWISAARSRWDAYVAQHGEIPPAGTKAVMGVDVAEFGADANVAAFRYGGYVERLVSWGGMDVVSTGDRAAEEYRARKVLRACVDATGVGSGVAPQMRRSGCAASAVKVAASPTERTELGEFERLRDQIWWSCREWLRTDSGAMLPPDEMLLEELATPTYEVRNGKIKIMAKDTMRELLKRSPDRADALCLTFYQPDLLFPGL